MIYDVDMLARNIVVIVALVVLIFYSTLFESQYPAKLVDLYLHPWWRLLVLFFLLAGILWCPRVGILVALVVFFYFADMNTLISPIIGGR